MGVVSTKRNGYMVTARRGVVSASSSDFSTKSAGSSVAKPKKKRPSSFELSK